MNFLIFLQLILRLKTSQIYIDVNNDSEYKVESELAKLNRIKLLYNFLYGIYFVITMLTTYSLGVATFT